MQVLDRSGDRLVVAWDDGTTDQFHYPWLRDNCPCPQCRHPQAQERLFDTAAMPAGIAPVEVGAGDALTLTWPDGHVTVLAQDWLREHAYGPGHRAGRTPAVILWDASIAHAPPEIDFAEIAAGDEGLLAWLELIERYGFALVRNLPTEVDAVLRLAERVAFVQESNFGRSFQVVSKPDPENLAYTAHRLNAHSDIPNRHSSVNLQFRHCLRFEAEGGESILVDGFEVARRFAVSHPDDYRLLASVEVPWRFRDATTDIINHAPVLDLDGDGRLRQIRFHTALLAPLDLDPELMGPFYDALRAFGLALRDPAVEYVFKMTPGDCQIFDNVRVLHGRAEFNPSSGPRHLHGCYVDRDDYLGKLRALRRGV